MSRIAQGDWCLTGALLIRGHPARFQLTTKAEKWREKSRESCFASNLLVFSRAFLLKNC